ncbi:hypothetical protein F5148DRAFT_1154131 [Russula earlei]|uniref:Uncharacterized protein n=1 Tax=Russula earlei TaxID=71964 RepID=A0ACC0TSB7_9AGAM|nr:hypothetical protein F5148DRAFT_1154131 [Russula earlei]
MAWPGRGDDAAPSPPTLLSAVHNIGNHNAMTTTATTERHKQPPRARMRSFSRRQMRFFKTLQVSVCDLPVPAGFLLLDARPAFPATSTPSYSTLDGTIPSLDTWMARNFNTPYEGQMAPPTPLPRRIHHLANTRLRSPSHAKWPRPTPLPCHLHHASTCHVIAIAFANADQSNTRHWERRYGSLLSPPFSSTLLPHPDRRGEPATVSLTCAAYNRDLNHGMAQAATMSVPMRVDQLSLTLSALSSSAPSSLHTRCLQPSSPLDMALTSHIRNKAMVGELWPSAEPVYDMSTVGSVTRATCKMWRTVTRVFLCPGIFALDGRASFVPSGMTTCLPGQTSHIPGSSGTDLHTTWVSLSPACDIFASLLTSPDMRLACMIGIFKRLMTQLNEKCLLERMELGCVVQFLYKSLTTLQLPPFSTINKSPCLTLLQHLLNNLRLLHVKLSMPVALWAVLNSIGHLPAPQLPDNLFNFKNKSIITYQLIWLLKWLPFNHSPLLDGVMVKLLPLLFLPLLL